jgi:hypothetical protein
VFGLVSQRRTGVRTLGKGGKSEGEEGIRRNDKVVVEGVVVKC